MPSTSESKAARAAYMRSWRQRNLETQRLKEREQTKRYRVRKHAEDPEWKPSRSSKPRDPAAHRAQEAVRRALKSGRLVKSSRCELCGSRGPIEAAHFNYSERLRVKWLCKPCHRQWDYHDPKSGEDIAPLTSPRGEEHSAARLTAEDVEIIRLSDLSHGDLALLFGVHKATIKDVRARRTWKHV